MIGDATGSDRKTSRRPRSLGLWEPVAKPEGPPDWFAEADEMPPFDPEQTAFTPINAWWLASLCRIAYTPDSRECRRRWHRDKPARCEFLETRTPFREVLNLHKTGSHAALYRLADRPGAVLCFRGTNKLRQWMLNLTALPMPWSRIGRPGVCVHHGFQILFERIWPLLEPALTNTTGPLWLTGHSLGAAFATLTASIFTKRPVAALMTFGSPRVGNALFAEALGEKGLPHHRVVNYHDVVSLLPQKEAILGERDYRHAVPPIILGSAPGEIRFGVATELAEDALERPLSWLARSFRAAEPPEGVLAHLPITYERKIMALPR